MEHEQLPPQLRGCSFSREKAYQALKNLKTDDGWYVIQIYLNNVVRAMTETLTSAKFNDKPDYFRGELYATLQMLKSPDHLMAMIKNHDRIAGLKESIDGGHTD